MSLEGDKFLDSSRNDNVWYLFKSRLGGEIHTLSISVTADLTKQLSKEYLKTNCSFVIGESVLYVDYTLRYLITNKARDLTVKNERQTFI